MILALTCALCATEPAVLDGNDADERVMLLDARLSLQQPDAPRPAAAPLPAVALAHDQGSSHGESHSGGHMGPMWILMGAMMAVMMIGMAVYLMGDANDARPVGPAASQSAAQIAIPVSRARGAGG
jgi:hypothetical protein